MIPLRDTIPRRTAPLVNGTLLAACAVVFLIQVAEGPQLAAFVTSWGFVPDRLFHPARYGDGALAAATVGLLTSTFLHGGFLHLAGNMLYLWVFGDNVEDALGHGRYLAFYLGSGALAALLQGVFAPSSTVPLIGASGAIAGVLGAYFVLYPRARILTLVPLFFLFPIVEVPAAVYLLFWFLMQFFMGTVSAVKGASGGAEGGVAWWAHVGGFLAGIALLALLRPRTRPVARYWIR